MKEAGAYCASILVVSLWWTKNALDGQQMYDPQLGMPQHRKFRWYLSPLKRYEPDVTQTWTYCLWRQLLI
ncbi:hypothetical protein PILCRDRAFT_827647 [Piloderma croceum F 1598]|uniref:Uncharacterized protein n=1 Tax=Piloderma croceum (strain F 1598) TaxID=765440 RepID=A0A0C3F4U3_PILCF|nr:hypothetical protein PILCRDRAFT_827647 [Piloderma croceum F 1598]